MQNLNAPLPGMPWRPLVSRNCRQRDGEYRVAGRASDRDGAVVRGNDGRSDGEAETGAAGLATARGIGAHKSFEERVDDCLIDPWAGVAHLEHRSGALDS